MLNLTFYVKCGIIKRGNIYKKYKLPLGLERGKNE